MDDLRRASDTPLGDTARILAVLYTVVFAAMVAALFFVPIPIENKDTINQLVGIMSAIQLAIIGFYFGGSKAAETSQRAGVDGRARADAVLQQIAKAVPAQSIKADDVTVSASGDVTVTEVKP